MARPVVLLGILLLGIAPVASADWLSGGTREPDTPEDVASHLMFLDPDAAPANGVHKVYFNAFATMPETSLNPNVGLVGSRILATPALHHRAILGVWKDCNGDGYIGSIESALEDYPTALLVDNAACPPLVSSAVPVHNDGMWVSEMLGIGMVDPCEREPDAVRLAACPGVDAFSANPRVLYADGTFVWADAGLPGSLPKTECILAPLPSGATSGSGALIGWADCQSRRGAADAVNAADSDGALGLRFDDPSHPEDSDSILNQRFPATLFGTPEHDGILQDDASGGAANVWDCGADPLATIDDPQGRREIVLEDPSGDKLSADTFPFVIPYSITGIGFANDDGDASTPGVFRIQLTDEEGRYASVPNVAPVVSDATGSWWRASEDALDGPAGDCDPGTPSALASRYPGSAVESDASPILEAHKDRTSATFTFYDGHRGLHPSLDPYTGDGAPSDGGTTALDHGRGGDGPIWSALAQSDQDPQLVDREDLGFTPALYFTYYATIGPAVLGSVSMPSTGALEYGAENCGESEGGIVRGWVCDASLWWKDADGADNTPRYAQGLRIGRLPGDAYHMRDVDCYDGSIVRGSGARASLVDLTDEGGCA